MSLNLTENDLNNSTVLCNKLVTLAEIIVRKHFYASLKEKDDLVSIGVLKALSLIKAGSWSRGKGSLVNYIYAGMRNDMHNYLYHQSKEVVKDPDYSEDSTTDKYFEDTACYIDYRIIHLVCMSFTGSFGDGIENRVIDEIKDKGFTVQGMGVDNAHTLKVFNDDIGFYNKTVEDDAVGRILGIIFWKRKEYDD